ncbi:cytochrome c oxidase subunit II [Marinimicrobium sp. ABcell2]|uniref:cytochrome c oxidase subunit II n=1 Tax=Marinimicrobium sp. ABcell2 TaxID=3069751 RepID=UPI0027AF0AEE|nr:cytochrome c oxidase subunit II [Marinimicrobium sp. ABcell2]MDQ2076243.1 cytochrome c oxidase subunit II [Marinimicrobium sp. ABcell2]
MLKRARRLWAWLLAPAVLMTSYQAMAEEVERWKFNMVEGVTPVSREIYGLHMQMFWWCVAISVVVFGIMLYSMIMHRKSRGVKAANFHESTALEIVWTAIPLAILIAMAFPATKSLINLYDASEAEIDVVITGYQWRWRYDYLDEDLSFFSNMSTPRDQIEGFEPFGPHYLLEVDEPLVIPVDTKVRFLITAADVIHSWWVPAFGVKKDAIPGFINESWAIVEEPGIYRGQCAELCGRDHAFMPIVVEALPKEEYQAWLQEKRAEQEAVRQLTEQTFEFEELYDRGRQVHTQWCAACHRPDGTGVSGIFPALIGGMAVGPVEDHLNIVVNGSRGTAMQAFGDQLSEVDIAAVVTYQRNAWGNNMGDSVQPIDVFNFKQND